MRLSAQWDALTPDDLRRRGTVKWNHFDPDVLALWISEMDYPTAPPVVSAIKAAVSREEFGYALMAEPSELASAVADWSAARYGWRVEAERVHLLPDVLRGIEVAIDHFSPADSAVVVPTPAYMPFFDIPKFVRRPVAEVPMLPDSGRYRLDLAGIDAAFASGAGTLILCQPHNPAGRSFGRDELLALCAVVAKHGARVVSDEIHSPLVYRASHDGAGHVPYASVSAEAAAHTITLTSAGKAWNLSGLGCAVAITSSDGDEENWRKIPPMRTHGATTIGIAASTAAFREGAAWLEEVLGYLDRNRMLLGELLAKHLPQVRYTAPEGTYLAWLDFRELRLPREPAGYFLRQSRVAMNPGLAFGANGAGFARLNFATTGPILQQAVEAMARAVR
jgi:cysteine-S-conjugate beta-lyase